MTTFDDQQEAISIAAEQLQEKLRTLREYVGATEHEVAYYDPGLSPMGTITDVLATLMACVDTLSARVGTLEEAID